MAQRVGFSGRKSAVLIALLTPLASASCAGGAQPATAPEPTPAATSAPASEGPAPDPKAAPKPGMESQREPFMQACMARAHVPDYCDCGFQQFREVFKDTDLSKPIEADNPLLKALREKTASACASKLNEEQIKSNFVEGCVAGDERKAAYCKCAWAPLRKQLALPDFIGDAETPRFAEAKKSMVAACKGKLPVEIAKNEFMSGCMKDHPDFDKTCNCLWTKIKAKFSAEELVAGTADVATVPGLKECRK